MATALRTDLFICPRCSSEVSREDGRLACTHCSASYPIVEGIPCFAPTDSFYDEYASIHCPYHLSPPGLKGVILRVLPFWSWREWKFWHVRWM